MLNISGKRAAASAQKPRLISIRYKLARLLQNAQAEEEESGSPAHVLPKRLLAARLWKVRRDEGNFKSIGSRNSCAAGVASNFPAQRIVFAAKSVIIDFRRRGA